MIKKMLQVFASDSNTAPTVKRPHAHETDVVSSAGSVDPLMPNRNDSYSPQEIQIFQRAHDAAMRTPVVINDVAGVTQAGYVGDSQTATDVIKEPFQGNSYSVPPGMLNWFQSQSFIGHQACALLAQHWLVDKACSKSGQDAIRHGFEINLLDETSLDESNIEQSGSVNKEQNNQSLTAEQKEKILEDLKEIDKKYELLDMCAEYDRWTNVYGLILCIFEVENSDPLYYEKPFNIDSVSPGSYKGMTLVEPYWTSPMLTMEGSSDPTSRHFYEPEFWVISGRKYHRSHLMIGRGETVADILKPMYWYGGKPLTQKLYERVYAAERTANEAPLLAMSKRTTVMHVDLRALAANTAAFLRRMADWVGYRDNYQVKVIGKDEVVEQFDISLTDFDTIMNAQYKLVATISEYPATELLGEQVSGLGATGEHETKMYNRRLESIQKNSMSPLVERHHKLAIRSLGHNIEVEHVWNPTDVLEGKELAELNKQKAETDGILIDKAIISPAEARQRVRNDKHSGYTTLDDDNGDFDLTNVEELKAIAKEQQKPNGSDDIDAQAELNQQEMQHKQEEHDLNMQLEREKMDLEREKIEHKRQLEEQKHAAGMQQQPANFAAQAAVQPPPLGHALQQGQIAPLSAPQAGPGAPAIEGDSPACAQAAQAGREGGIAAQLADPEMSGLIASLRAIVMAQPRAGAQTQGTGQPSDFTAAVERLRKIVANMPSPMPATEPVQAPSNEQGQSSGVAPETTEKSASPSLPKMSQIAVGTHGDINPSASMSVKPTVNGLLNDAKQVDAELLPAMRVHGLNIRIENPKGSVRRGVDADGRRWASVMPEAYGFIEGIRGNDGDDLDVFVKYPVEGNDVHVINQINPETREFDEHKVIIGVKNAEAAKTLYDAAYSKDWKGFSSMASMPLDEFKQWMQSGDLGQPVNVPAAATTNVELEPQIDYTTQVPSKQ